MYIYIYIYITTASLSLGAPLVWRTGRAVESMPLTLPAYLLPVPITCQMCPLPVCLLPFLPVYMADRFAWITDARRRV